jgi:uncharacterized protein YacL
MKEIELVPNTRLEIAVYVIVSIAAAAIGLSIGALASLTTHMAYESLPSISSMLYVILSIVLFAISATLVLFGCDALYDLYKSRRSKVYRSGR